MFSITRIRKHNGEKSVCGVVLFFKLTAGLQDIDTNNLQAVLTLLSMREG